MNISVILLHNERFFKLCYVFGMRQARFLLLIARLSYE